MGQLVIASAASELAALRAFLEAAVHLPPCPFPQGPFSGEAIRVVDPSSLRGNLSRLQRESRSWERLLTFWRSAGECGNRMGTAVAHFPEAIAALGQAKFPITDEVLQWATRAGEQGILLRSSAAASLSFVGGGGGVAEEGASLLIGFRDAMADLALVPPELREAARQAVRDGHLRREGLGGMFQAYLRNVGRRIPQLGLPVLAVMLTGAFALSGGFGEEL